MFWAMDSSEPGKPRERRDSSLTAMFFIGWTLVGCFFAMQLFVGVVVEQFNSIRVRKDGSGTMTSEQRQWVSAQEALLHVRAQTIPRQLPGVLDTMIFATVSSVTFQRMMNILLVCSVGVLCSDHFGSNPASTLNAWRSGFTYLFCIEAGLKLRAFGQKFYTHDTWCRFEGMLAAISLADEWGLLRLVGQLFRLPVLLIAFLGSLQALRALRLVQHASGLQSLVLTIIQSLPSLVNVSLLLLLVIFIYSVVGVQV